MDAYVLYNNKDVRIVGEVKGPGTWCYIRKNGKKSKVTQVYSGAVFRFNNFKHPDIKAYEITGKFTGLQRSVASGEVHKLPLLVAESECKYCKSKLDALASRCDKLEAALEAISALIPKTDQNPHTADNISSSPSQNHHESKRQLRAVVQEPDFFETDIELIHHSPSSALHILHNCTDSIYDTVECELDKIEEINCVSRFYEYNESLIAELLEKLSHFIKGGNDIDILDGMETCLWVEKTLVTPESYKLFKKKKSPYPMTDDVGYGFFAIFSSHHVPKIIYSLFFVKHNMPNMVKAYYATYLKYLYYCKENKKHPFDNASLTKFKDDNFNVAVQ